MIGKTLSHYKIVSQLGKGGMGEVWRAEDTTLGREVAIKVLPEAVASDPERLARFEREAKVLAALDHGNIAAIYGLEEVDGRQLLVMQLVEGENLQQRIARGALSLEEALPITRQIAEALESAHEKGIVHRDLKPANVMVTPEGQVKVLDFGLAKALEGDPASSGSHPQLTQSPTLTAQMTGAGVLLGTAAYMSPEQARGQTADRRADIWALGVVLMEMLTGETVYAGDTLSDTLAGVLAREPEWDSLPETTPQRVRSLLERCLDKEARTRLRDVGEARIAIDAYLANPHEEEEQAAAAAGIVATQPTWKRLLPWAIATTAVLALVATYLGFRPESEPPKPLVRLEAVLSDEPLSVNLGSSVELSPSGDKIAYVTDSAGNLDLYLRSFDQSVGNRIGAASGEGSYHPFFSPDGEWIGFVTSTELKKMPVTGGTPMTLCAVERSRGASWAPDGTIIIAAKALDGLFRVSEAGGELEPLTTLDSEAGEISHRWPQVLPGGKAALFTSATEAMSNSEEAVIEAVILDTGERKVIRRGGYYPRYVPTGHLVFISNGTLFGMTFDLDALEPTGSPAPLVEGVTSNSGPGSAQYSLASNGTLSFVSGEIGAPEYPIVWVDRSGRISSLWDTPASYSSPKLSPDGTTLALSVLRDGNWDIWVYDLDREVATRLTFHDGYDADQFWMPDGKYIVFTSDREGAEAAFRKRADGSGDAELLSQTEKDFWPSGVSPDGRILIGETLGDSTDILILDLEGSGEPEPYLASSFDERYPAFSPDGRWVAYASNESDRMEIYVRPFPATSGKWQVSDGGGAWPLWSDDSRELFYRTATGITAVEVDGTGSTFTVGKPQPLFEGNLRGGITGIPIGGFVFSDYDVSPDGQRLVMFPGGEETLSQTHVTLMFNWFDELKKTLPQ